jgi:hypothetical protein
MRNTRASSDEWRGAVPVKRPRLDNLPKLLLLTYGECYGSLSWARFRLGVTTWRPQPNDLWVHFGRI